MSKMVFRIYVGSYTNEIYTLSFDPGAQSLTLVSSITVGHHPSWITPDTTDSSVIYAGLEEADGKIVAVKFDADGKGIVIGKQSSLGKDPCSLVASGSTLFIGNVSTPRQPFFCQLNTSLLANTTSLLAVLIRNLRHHPFISRPTSSDSARQDLSYVHGIWAGPGSSDGAAPSPGHLPPRSRGASHS